MIETYIFWAVSFVGLFLASFWIQVIFFVESNHAKVKDYFPKVSILVPAWNRENGIGKTLNSLVALDYPKNKMEIIVIDDGSIDKTAEITKRYSGVILLQQKNMGKASALNLGLSKANGEFVACVDADSTVDKESLKRVMENFNGDDIGAVISTIKIKDPRSMWQKMQHYEYLLTAYIRKLMSDINTLYVTPGVLSVYRTEVIKKLGGFDNGNLTEDLEVALRLKKNHYKIIIERESITYTDGPASFWVLWRQRVRWFRGLIYNSIKYRGMIFNSKYGLFGLFQFPLIAITQFVLIVSFSMIVFHVAESLYKNINSLILLGGAFFTSMEFRGVKEIVYNINPMVFFPISIALLLSLFLLYRAHKNLSEKWSYFPALFLYFFLLPLLSAMHWVWAIVLEVMGAKKRW